MNKKSILIVASLVILGLGGGYYYLNSQKSTTSGSGQAKEQGQPERTAEIKGKVKSIEGNELVIINEISTEPELTDAEKAAKKAERQKLSQEERQALKEQESTTLKKEDVKVTIPVGVAIKKGVGDTSGALTDAEMAEIKMDVYISVWIQDINENPKTAEFVKIRGTN